MLGTSPMCFHDILYPSFSQLVSEYFIIDFICASLPLNYKIYEGKDVFPRLSCIP